MKGWYEINEKTKTKPQLVFPVTILTYGDDINIIKKKIKISRRIKISNGFL